MLNNYQNSKFWYLACSLQTDLAGIKRSTSKLYFS